MFQSNMMESMSSEVRLENLSRKTYLMIAQYLYTRDTNINADALFEYLFFASQFMLDDLVGTFSPPPTSPYTSA